MNWIKKDVRTAQTASIDPRIDSPEIKIVYPSADKNVPQASEGVLKSTVAAPTATTETPQSSPQLATEILAAVPKTTPAVEVSQPETITAPTWLDIVKQNAGLFLLCAAISLGIGILIGKKLKV